MFGVYALCNVNVVTQVAANAVLIKFEHHSAEPSQILSHIAYMSIMFYSIIRPEIKPLIEKTFT